MLKYKVCDEITVTINIVDIDQIGWSYYLIKFSGNGGKVKQALNEMIGEMTHKIVRYVREDIIR